MTPPMELLEAIAREDGEAALRDLDSAGTLTTALLPELEEGRGFDQPALHHYTVLEHNFAAVGALDRALGAGVEGLAMPSHLDDISVAEWLGREIDGRPLQHLLRLSCLVHDIAKPRTAVVREGKLRFPRHGPVGAELLEGRLAALGFEQPSIEFVTTMVRYHLRPGEFARSWPPTDRALRRFARDLSGETLPLLLLQLADGMATRGPTYRRENFERHLAFLGHIVTRTAEALREEEPALVDGEELMRELGLPSGRLLGAVLTSVREAQLAGEVDDRATALALARQSLERLNAEG
ncbi:MAG: HD domain-containing protein [Dehalococcoidia bacterium]|nr:HD domain-containing protein [Dehalococcoidia bacterium]MYI86216.1 HD domain-containing protein [Dehalococcoidia bacterium]